MTYQEALTAAQVHVAETPLDHPDYRLGFSQPTPVAEGWYFNYTIEPAKPIPESEQESSLQCRTRLIVPSDGRRAAVVPGGVPGGESCGPPPAG